jgi:hypothetical protein
MRPHPLLLGFSYNIQDANTLTPSLSRPGNYFISLDLADGYYTLGIREENRDYFTVTCRGELRHLVCLPMGWSGSAYY